MRSDSSSSSELSTHRFGSSSFAMARRRMLATSLALLTSVQFVYAQPPAKPTVEDRDLVTKDDHKLKVTYFKSTSGKDAAVIVMLHGKGGNRLNWKGFATDLQQKGDFAVVTVDLRGHGESSIGPHKKPELKKADYQAMVAYDMESVKEFVFEEHQKGHLNMNKFGIVACDFSAAVAVLYTDVDWDKVPFDDSPIASEKTPRGQDIQALALISPDMTAPGLLPTKAIAGIRVLRRPVMIGACEKNVHDVTAANKMYEQLSPKKDREKEKEDHLYYEKYEGNLHGMDLVLKNATIRGHIFAFLTKHVKEYQSEWRERRSRLDRD